MVKRKLLTYYGERWKGFKTQLTHDYINNPRYEDDLECNPPYLMYSFIDLVVWEKFVKSHTTLGGSETLEKKMIEEKK